MKKTKIITLFLLLSLFLIPESQAVVFVKKTDKVENVEQLRQKEQKKMQRLQKKIDKWNAKTTKRQTKVRKNKYGRLGLLVLLGGVLSLVLFDFLFGLSLLASMILGAIGLARDENKTAAIFAILIPVAFLTIVFIQLASIFGA